MVERHQDVGVGLRLYGSLRSSGPHGTQTVEVTGPMTLSAFINRIGLDRASVRVAMINHRAVLFDAPVAPGDSVALFPSEYPFFADWKDFWPSQHQC